MLWETEIKTFTIFVKSEQKSILEKKKKKIAPAKGFLLADREPKQGSDSSLRVTGEGTHRLLSHPTASKMSRFWLPLLSSQDKGKHHDTAKDVPGQ